MRMILIVYLRCVMGQKACISVIVAIEVIKWVSSATHDAVELLEVEHTVTIAVGFLQHLLELVVGDLLAYFSRDSF